ncbi:MAG: hypothetical protein GF349_03585 [Candidatus Magasanikbacteria bacterium]|nr:hypothetical protein [Candidatus Magasanikbacteria bacterium]
MRFFIVVALAFIGNALLGSCSTEITRNNPDECYFVYADKSKKPIGPISCAEFEEQLKDATWVQGRPVEESVCCMSVEDCPENQICDPKKRMCYQEDLPDSPE